MTQIPIEYDLAYGDLRTAIFVQRGLGRALRFHASEFWPTDRHSLEDLVQSIDGVLLLDSHETAALLAGSRLAEKLELARVKELLPPSEPPVLDLINVGFWYRTTNGARKVNRHLTAVDWAEGSPNYPVPTRDALEFAMADVNAVLANGRLILWHGPTGTGKTSALRTLARENRDVLAVEYVLDPESLFGREAGYFVKVLFNEDEEETAKMRLFVLEDCDELLSADAKERAGQGLARLLNLVDGLIGQGLKIGVLITTNEPLSGFHPAVSRPGRCGAMVSFERFSIFEAVDWLAGHDSAAQVRSRLTLAELFAVREGREGPKERSPIGFVGSSRELLD